jgi:hypothetical protein
VSKFIITSKRTYPTTENSREEGRLMKLANGVYYEIASGSITDLVPLRNLSNQEESK